MNRIFKSILLLAVILLQTTILSRFAPFGTVPNFVFVTVFVICVVSSDTDSVVFAGLAGLLVDMFTGSPFGVNTLMYIYFSIVLILIADAIYNKNAAIFAPICFVASFICEFFQGVLSFLLRSASVDIVLVMKVSLSAAMINTVIFIPVYIVLKRVKFEKKRKGIKYEQ